MKNQFREPQNLREALERKTELDIEIVTIERQLTDPERRDRSGRLLDPKAYRQWKQRAHNVYLLKKAEQLRLRRWIKERRRAVDAEQLGITDPDDPVAILLAVREELNQGEEADLGLLRNVINQFFEHAA